MIIYIHCNSHVTLMASYVLLRNYSLTNLTLASCCKQTWVVVTIAEICKSFSIYAA